MSLFPLGRMVATPSLLQTLAELETSPNSLLIRHARGDWGQVNSEDWQANERALMENDRLFSVYLLTNGSKVYVITEADRLSTTLLLSHEY